MVKVVMVTAKNDPVPLEFKDIYGACSAMHTLANSVVGGCAFTVSFEKEEPEKSRFINPQEV
jgi:hypothetical protein